MKTITPTEIRNYLLGKMERDERALEDFMAACYGSDENVERLEEARDDLIESYLRGRLTKADAALFESHFLDDPENRDSFDFSKSLRAQLAADERLAGAVAADRKKRGFSLGGVLVPVAVAAVVMVGGVFLWRVVNLPSAEPIARRVPTPAVNSAAPSPVVNSATPPPVSGPTEVPEKNAPPTPFAERSPAAKTPVANTAPTPAAPPKEATGRPEVFLGFAAPKGGDEAVLKIAKGRETAYIQTVPLRQTAESYTVVVTPAGGEPPVYVSERTKFATEKSPDGRARIVIDVPAANFKAAGTYLFEIRAKDAEGRETPLRGPIPFRVEKEN